MDILLYEPEIPPNTGNIMRLCSNTGAGLHLIEPLGFTLDDRQLRRAGLDYREWAHVQTYPSLANCLSELNPPRLFAISTRAQQLYTAPCFRHDDAFLFGPETRGLPQNLLAATPPNQCLRIPMYPNNRSLNLSNAVAVVLYEAWRQCGFLGAHQANRT